jgi:hypothetical protein
MAGNPKETPLSTVTYRLMLGWDFQLILCDYYLRDRYIYEVVIGLVDHPSRWIDYTLGDEQSCLPFPANP